MDGRHPAPDIAMLVRGALATGSRRIEEAGATRAAVLVGLFEVASAGPHVWLIRRPDGLRSHAGQVALPGGKADPSDPNAAATALREANEEIGLPPEHVEVLGLADDLSTSTGYVVTPVVGWITAPFTVRANPGEVARTFSAPLAAFQEEGLLGLVPIEALRRVLRAYRIEGEVVWGATAAILSTFARRLPPLAR